MNLKISEEPLTFLEQYATVPIAFEVSQVLDVASNSCGEFILTQRLLGVPYIKNYDAIDGNEPTQWAQHFDVSKWAVFAARMDGRHVGGATLAFKTPGLDMLEGREDLAVLWDIRIAPKARGQGIGSALFHEAETWATARGCKQLKVETQNTNAPACRLYKSRGCGIGAVHQGAYLAHPDEVQILWYKNL